MKRFRILINPFGDLLFCTFFYSVCEFGMAMLGHINEGEIDDTQRRSGSSNGRCRS
jgi:hypothetical protein